MDVALYRKYRPQSFEEVVGQDHIIEVLKDAVSSGKIAHSYLFYGSRGTGKTSVARILAREIGTLPEDLYEIDAASNRGIDDARELRDGVRSFPFRSPYKVYIVDECHMLTKEAFNALLKTLEEPPKHVVFVLATTELSKLPETIISRCETHTFRKPSNAILKKVIVEVAKKEGYSLPSAGADLISLLGDGSFRDTLGVLQKVFHTAKEKKILLEDVERATHAPPHGLLNDLIETISLGDLSRGLSVLKDASDAQIDFELFLKLLLKRLRAILLLRYAKEMKKNFEDEYTSDELLFLETHAKNPLINSQTLCVFLDAYAETKNAYIPELPIELALIKLLGKS